jgi:hypothetical protein
MKDIAKDYKSYGLSVIPVKTDKRPAISWNKYQKQVITDSEIDNYFSVDCFIAVVCGAVSGGLEVLDFDNHQDDAKDRMIEYFANPEVKAIYEKYKLPVEKSAGGGYHVFYRCSKIEGNKKLAEVPVWNEKLNKWRPDAVIETRGEGGYVIIAPSKGYVLQKNSFEVIAEITQEERKVLISVARSFNKWEKPQPKNEYENSDKPGDLFNDDVNAESDVKSILRSAGWTELNHKDWRRPNKSKGISATFNYVAKNVFYCFTANGYPFEPQKAYSPFQVKALLEHNGDFKECAKELAKRYDLVSKKEIKRNEPVKAIEAKNKNSKKYDFEALQKLSIVNPRKKIEKEPTILQIHQFGKDYRMMTLGNFSAWTGKSKSRKSFASSMAESAMVSNKTIYGTFKPSMIKGKENVIRIDTEQSKLDVQYAQLRVNKMCEKVNGIQFAENYSAYYLRELNYADRCQFISDLLKKSKNLGCLIIDGYADLAYGNNDEAEATRLTELLMYWSSFYNIHISGVIHQPRSHNFATGHVGSQIEKKAESVMSITKEGEFSMITPMQMRGKDFEPFTFGIDENVLPYLPDYTETENFASGRQNNDDFTNSNFVNEDLPSPTNEIPF